MSSTDDKYSRIEYRRLIAWPQRIAREAPLLLRVLEAGPSRRLLDLGCGTGEHARYLVAEGFEVVGVDASESMVAKAREEPLPKGLELIRGDVRQLEELVQGPFGGALCLGNTLPHLRAEADLLRFFCGLRQVMSPGAPLLLQLLNYERIFARNERALPVNLRPDGDGEIVFLRLMELHSDGEVSFFPSTLRLQPGTEPPLEIMAAKEVRLRGWRVSEVEEQLDAAGFEAREHLGSFDGSPFAALESRDLIVVAR
jgi:SAM-dependent methyltransferase